MRDSRISGKDRLLHIKQSIDEIESYTENVSNAAFLDDPILINAVLFKFSIIGEAVIYIDDELLAKYEYPWYKVRGFRNFILHEYHAIEYRIVWEAIKKDLPVLKAVINEMLEKEF